MTRQDAIDRIRLRFARAFELPVSKVHVEWDEQHGKPKVTLASTMETVLMAKAKRDEIFERVLAGNALRDELAFLRQAPSDALLGAQLKALRDRKNAS